METDDPNYKKKRKALSAAFFKNKVAKMTMSVKEHTLRKFKELQAKGSENRVDLNLFTQNVQASIIVSILVGQKYCDQEVPYVDMNDGS